MPRKNSRLIGQRQYLLLNAGEQRLPTPAREVGATDGTLENHITTEEQAIIFKIKDHMP